MKKQEERNNKNKKRDEINADIYMGPRLPD